MTCIKREAVSVGEDIEKGNSCTVDGNVNFIAATTTTTKKQYGDSSKN